MCGGVGHPIPSNRMELFPDQHFAIYFSLSLFGFETGSCYFSSHHLQIRDIKDRLLRVFYSPTFGALAVPVVMWDLSKEAFKLWERLYRERSL